MVSFANVKTVSKPSPKGKATKASIKIDGLLQFAALNNAMGTIETLKKTYEDEVKTQMLAQFITAGSASGLKPESFEGTEDQATASCEIRKRSIRSVLSSTDRAILADHKIPVEETTSETETLIFNPAYLNDAKLMAKIEAALNKIPGLPDDIIMKQEGVTTFTVSDATVNAVFATKDKAKLELLIPIVTTLAVKPKLDDDTVVADTIRTLLLGETKKTAKKAAK
jgi:hypothetical protein